MTRARKFSVAMLCVMAVVFIFSVIPAHAIWHVFLDEHFNKDQQNPNLRWPWMTDLRVGLRWHWNPWPQWPLAEPNPTDYCWGIQSEIFNSRVTPRDAIQQALWCAYTNRGNVNNNRRWPDVDDYMTNQNAWVWWGPVSLENAVSANVSFWMYLDLTAFSRDSLSVVALNDPGLLTLDDNPWTADINEFFEYIPIGRSYSYRINNDWVWQNFYLDSLVLAGDTENLVSMLGEPEVYIAFVWQSDQYAVTQGDKGAFIDDVIFAWDDGLFDIIPTRFSFGYPVNEDSTSWLEIPPRKDEQIYFRADYRVIGVGDTPEFEIQLLHNDTLWYSTTVARNGADDTTYTVVADTLWTCDFGNHQFRWEFDVPVREGGQVEEGNENNNTITKQFSITYNPPPLFELMPVEGSDTVYVDGFLPISVEWTLQDTLSDNSFNVYLYWTEDTTGLAEDPEIIRHYGYVGRIMGTPRGEGRFDWSAQLYKEELQIDQVIKIVAVATDRYPGNYVRCVSPAWYCWHVESVNETGQPIPAEFGLGPVYPNPFNSVVSINYGLTTAGDVDLGVFDMSGRLIERLAQGWRSAGQYRLEWQPEYLPAGLYMLRMQSGASIDLKKVVYMP